MITKIFKTTMRWVIAIVMCIGLSLYLEFVMGVRLDFSLYSCLKLFGLLVIVESILYFDPLVKERE